MSELNFELDFKQFLTKPIKTEPLDEPEFIAPPTPPQVEIPVNSAKLLRYSVDEPPATQPTLPFLMNQVNYQAGSSRDSSQSAPQRVSRDPRLKNVTVPVKSDIDNSKRKAFLDRALTAEDLINATKTRSSDFQSKKIRQIRDHCGEAQKLVNSQSTSFYASLPNVPVLPSGFEQQRSPLITSNHNALFISHATTANAREALEAQRYRNISPQLQEIGQRIGVDLDAISQQLITPKEEVLISYSLNTRSFHTQTDAVEDPVPVTSRSSSVRQEHKEVQTTKNDGFFSFTYELSKLTAEQRKALEEFKKVMNIKDEITTSAVMERLQHKRANRTNNNHQDSPRSSQNSHYSRESDVNSFSNPPPPERYSNGSRSNYDKRRPY